MSFGQISVHGQNGEAARRGVRLTSGVRLALILGAIWAVLAGLTLMPGALVLSLHEGDAIHLAAMVLRMADGQWPHLDYMTPIGALAVAPIAGLVSLGMGLGQAFVWSQILVAAALLPAIWWVAYSRFGGGWLSVAFGALVVFLTMSYVHGGTTPSISISMHYNRWAWALAYLVMALVLLPGAVRPAPRLEGAILGISLAILALLKVTYAVALLPAVLLALALRRDGALFLWGTASSLAALGAVTLVGGRAFWSGYIGDLLAVATSTSRSAPGHSFADVLVAPTHLAGTLVGLGAVMVLRRSGRETEGLVLLALLPGLAVITWQNFGNEAQWLPVLALALLALPGASASRGHVIAAAVALALSAGWMINVAASGIRMAAADPGAASPVFPALPAHTDFRLGQPRLETVETVGPYAPLASPPDAPAWGAALPECDLRAGGVRVFQAIAAELERAGFAGRRILVADTFQSFWLFGDFPPLPGGAPWYYDGLPGGADAEIIVVPLCPINHRARERLLAAVATAGWELVEIHRGQHAAVLEIRRP